MTGQPVAWVITDTEEINCYEEFFKAIKATVPDETINTLMTDDCMIMHATRYRIDNVHYLYRCIYHWWMWYSFPRSYSPVQMAC